MPFRFVLNLSLAAFHQTVPGAGVNAQNTVSAQQIYKSSSLSAIFIRIYLHIQGQNCMLGWGPSEGALLCDKLSYPTCAFCVNIYTNWFIQIKNISRNVFKWLLTVL